MPYHAVARGRKIGVTKSWKECQNRVQGYRGALYESFERATDAYHFVERHRPDLYSERNAHVYIDGAFQGTQCGYGVFYGLDDSRNASVPLYSAQGSTPFNNQRAELMAAIHVLNNIREEVEINGGVPFRGYIIFADCQTTVTSLSRAERQTRDAWKRASKMSKEQANNDLITQANAILKKLESIYEDTDYDIRVEHVYAHVGVRGNAEADRLATRAAEMSAGLTKKDGNHEESTQKSTNKMCFKNPAEPKSDIQKATPEVSHVHDPHNDNEEPSSTAFWFLVLATGLAVALAVIQIGRAYSKRSRW